MRHPKRAVAASIIALTLALAGCSANDPLAEQYRDGTDQNYIAGDGSVLEVAAANRDEPIVFEGVTETGEQVSSTDHLGEVLVVNFWASYCVPCRVEAPDLEALSQEWADDGVTYASVMDAASGSAQLAFAGNVPPSALPTTIVLDREGRVAARILGQLQAKSILDAIIERVASETSSGSQG